MSNIELPQTYNLHTHTFRCLHAEGDVDDYAAVAAAAGAELLGFSEHPPLLSRDIWDPFRMKEESLEGYFEAVGKAATAYPRMRILTGFEMDLYPRYKSYYEDKFLYRKEIDFLAGGVHWIVHHGDWMWVQDMSTAGHLGEYVSEIVGLMESGLMSFITHPDIFASGYLKWDDNAESCTRDILEAAEEYSVPLEINGNGLRRSEINTPDGPRKPYPLLKFWEMAASYNISVVCNSDAHKPEDTMSELGECHDIMNKFSLKHHPVKEVLLKAS